MSEKFTLETHMRIYNDNTGDYLEVRPDTDGLDLIEINGFVSGEKTGGLTMHPAEALLVAEALVKLASSLSSNDSGSVNHS